MKKIFKYFGIFLSVAFMGALTSCNIEEITESADLGLGIKVFFPTKVVAGQPMTINGSGFSDVREIVFPNGVTVSNFEIVSDDMIRVTAPAGIAASGGNIIVRTADEEAESRLPLTLGSTVISGYSKQEGESISGGEQLTIFGKDLEFINSVELKDKDGNPLIVDQSLFYRKGTSSVMVTIPKKSIYDGAFVGKVNTFDGQVFEMPELVYSPASDGGHWETVKTVIWENTDPDGNGAVSWNGKYRFSNEEAVSGEEIAAIPMDIWEKMKTTTFYVDIKAEDPQVRVTTGWWSTNLTADDIQPGSDLLTDNGDGTWTVEVSLAGSGVVTAMDVEHLLLTGDRYTPMAMYFKEEVWVEGGGHMEIVKTPVWANDDPDGNGAVSWNGTYRFSNAEATTGEEIYAIPMDIWEKMKTTTFYVDIKAEDPQVRVTTGWWSTNLTADDIQPGSDLLTDNGDGTWTVEVTLAGSGVVDAMDVEHLLFTGDRYTPLLIYFQEEVWVGGGGDSGPKEVDVWVNDDPDGHGAVSWNGTYRFSNEDAVTGEEIAAIPMDVWEKLKTTTFYLDIKAEDPQVRVTTGWWSTNLTAEDIQPGCDLLTDNGDGTWTVEITLAGTGIVDAMDVEHLLFTGDRYTPLKFYFLE